MDFISVQLATLTLFKELRKETRGGNFSMKTYKVALTRTYLVSIKTENKEQVKRLSEFYIGDCPDRSSIQDRLKKKFIIEDIEMIYNEAEEVLDVED